MQGSLDDYVLSVGMDEIIKIAQSNDPSPDQDGQYPISIAVHPLASINDNGDVGHFIRMENSSGFSFTDRGVFISNGTDGTSLFREGQEVLISTDVPDTTNIIYSDNFGNVSGVGPFPLTNNQETILYGEVTFFPSTTRGIFKSTAGAIIPIALNGERPPEESATAQFDFPLTYGPNSTNYYSINQAGNVVFTADVYDSGVNSYVGGVYLYKDDQISLVARPGQQEPVNTIPPPPVIWEFLDVIPALLNNVDTVAFKSRLLFPGLPTWNGRDNGIYTSKAGIVKEVVRTGQTLPSDSFLYMNILTLFDINDNDVVLFRAAYNSNPNNIANSKTGLFLHNGTAIEEIVVAGTPVPGRNKVFLRGGIGVLNNNNQVLFSTSYADSINSQSGESGIFLYGNGEITEVTSNIFSNFSNRTLPGTRTFNDQAQFAKVILNQNNKRELILFTPDLEFKNSSSNWDDLNNWTLGILPGTPHDVSISPNSGVIIVTGSSSVQSIRSLLIGNSSGSATLNIVSDLNVSDSVTVASNGILNITSGTNANVYVGDNLGSASVTDSVVVKANGTLDGAGSVQADIQCEAGSTCTAGSSPGVLTVDGDFTLDGGKIVIEVAGDNLQDTDLIDVTGDVVLMNGVVEFVFINGFVPNQGFNLEFIQSSSITINPSVNFSVSGLPGTVEFDITSTSSGIDFMTSSAVATATTVNVPLPLWSIYLLAGTIIFYVFKIRKQHS